jgi:signal transduction histidine kinase
MIYIILVVCILSFLVGFFVLVGNPLSAKNLSFALFCVIASIWTLFNFLIYYTYNLYYPHPAYAFGILIISAILSWTYIYYEKDNAMWKHVIIYLFGGSIAYMSLFTNLIIKEVQDITATGIVIEEGRLFSLFLIYLICGGLFATWRMFLFYKREKGVNRHKYLLIFAGMGLYIGVSLFVSGLLPAFGIFTFTNLDSVSSIFFIIFTCIAIYKHNFLGVKLALAQLLILFIVSINVIQLLHSVSLLDYILKFTLLFFIVVLGGVLILAIKREVKRTEEVEAANSQLRELDKKKSEFISMASHQLRTPLTTMKGFIGVIQKGAYGEIPPTFKEPIDVMENANNRLIALVEDMLDVSRMELGKTDFSFKKHNINEIVEELHASFGLIAKEKNIALHIDMDPAMPEIMLDEAKMRETLSNIIDNALKYTKEGSVTMSTKYEGSYAKVLVTDTGIGIMPEEKHMLFEKFSRGQKAKEIKKEGLGLGLYMGRKIVEAHGGTIHALPHEGDKGMTFVVELPTALIKK